LSTTNQTNNPNSSLHILHVIPGLTRERGGPSAVVQALVKHQVAAGHAVTVLTTDQGARRGEQPVELAAAARVCRLAVRGPDRVAYAAGFRKAASDEIRAADIVHVHSIFTYPVHITLRLARRAGVPLVLRPCGMLDRYSLRRSWAAKGAYLQMWGRMVRRACTAWHYTSANEAAQSWPWEPIRHFVLPNGVDPAEFAVDGAAARAAVRQRWPDIGDAPYALFLGRLHRKKRLDLLLEAFAQAAPAGCKLVVAGPGAIAECGMRNADLPIADCGLRIADSQAGQDPQSEIHNPQLPAAEKGTGIISADGSAVEDTVRRAEMKPVPFSAVVRIGMVGGADKANLLAAARLFVLPSEHENFGIAALEALAAGTPVLLSPHVDLAADATAAGFGAVAPLDVRTWAEQLSERLRQPEDEEKRRATRAWVAEHYAWEKIAARLEAEYERVLQR
jgi:glycosyltransferase involved in cell wall biosynthesis